VDIVTAVAKISSKEFGSAFMEEFQKVSSLDSLSYDDALASLKVAGIKQNGILL